ncbi:DUF2062 domain-containing protein [Candidatus Electronema sp. JM]|uniref:DUF2062 domain-containing protein n=1 Tax=Candidatus Electronema sp. JM TaxID=3401571 RepID=UPI003AA90269
MTDAARAWFRMSKYHFLRLRRLKGDPEYLARGVGFGVFIGNLPLIPQSFFLVSLTMLLRISTVAAFISSTVVNNPLTVMFQYYLSWKVGSAVLPGGCSWTQLQAALRMFDQGLRIGLSAVSGLGMKTLGVLLTGGTIIGVVSGVACYLGSRWFFWTVKRKRAMKHRLNNRA